MKITLVTDSGHRVEAMLPYDGADHVTVSVDCPHGCVRKSCLGIVTRLKVRGLGIDRTSHDTHYARAVALCCGIRIGTLETTFSTVFGIHEDEAVLGGPWKVY